MNGGVQIDWKMVLAVTGSILLIGYVIKQQAKAAVGAVVQPIEAGAQAVEAGASTLSSEIADWFTPTYNPNAPTAAQQPTSSSAQPFGITTSGW